MKWFIRDIGIIGSKNIISIKNLRLVWKKLGKNLYVDGAFTWKVTEDGWNFWNDIDDKWLRALRIEGYDND